MFKRLVTTVFVTSLAVFGLAPAAGAATSSSGAAAVKVVKAHTFKPGKPDLRIDWDAPPADSGVVSTLRIDWD